MKKGAKHGRRRRAEAVGESESGSVDVVLEMQIQDVRRDGHDPEGYETVTLVTNRGEVETRYYPAQGPAQGRTRAPSTRAAVFVGGAGGGFDTPVRGWLYPWLCRELQGDGVAALRVRYRRPNDLLECALDVLAGGAFLEVMS